ncbi:MAG: hypothetical protein AMXMBFR77_27030 [Phycisphaerales bacterium]
MTTKSKSTTKGAKKPPRMSKSAARAEGAQRTKAALAAKTAAAPDGPVVLPEEAAKRRGRQVEIVKTLKGRAPAILRASKLGPPHFVIEHDSGTFSVARPSAPAGDDAPSAAGPGGVATDAAAAPDATRANTARHGAKARKPARKASPKRVSGLDLAARVLAKAGEPLSAKAIAERAIAAGWETNGKTPEATLYAAMTREIATKGSNTRFLKVGPGRFAPSGKGD